MRDFAFGGCCGGSKGGATFDTACTKSSAGAPSLVEQITHYTVQSPHTNIKKALQFIWVGQNDVSAHTHAFWEGYPKNSQFSTDATTKTVAAVKTLLGAGTPVVFVSNICPTHISPSLPNTSAAPTLAA
jgi:hypothetical protein